MRLSCVEGVFLWKYQTYLIVNPSALWKGLQKRSHWICHESAWSNYATTERYFRSFAIAAHHHATCTDTLVKTGLTRLGAKACEGALGTLDGATQTVWIESCDRESLRSRVWGKNYKWHVNPGAPSNNFPSRGWGPLISPLSSLTALWGVIYASMEV